MVLRLEVSLYDFTLQTSFKPVSNQFFSRGGEIKSVSTVEGKCEETSRKTFKTFFSIIFKNSASGAPS
jgi:hypothetical protein